MSEAWEWFLITTAIGLILPLWAVLAVYFTMFYDDTPKSKPKKTTTND